MVILRNGTMRWKKWVKAEDGLTKNFLIVRTCRFMKNAGRSVNGVLVSIALARLCDCAVALGFVLVWSGRLHNHVHYVRPTFSQSPSLHVSLYCSVIDLMCYLSSGGNNSQDYCRFPDELHALFALKVYVCTLFERRQWLCSQLFHYYSENG